MSPRSFAASRVFDHVATLPRRSVTSAPLLRDCARRALARRKEAQLRIFPRLGYTVIVLANQEGANRPVLDRATY
jgi:hypothetical protein